MMVTKLWRNESHASEKLETMDAGDKEMCYVNTTPTWRQENNRSAEQIPGKSRRFWVKLEACKTDQQTPRSKTAPKFSVTVVGKVFETSKGVNLSFESSSTTIIKHYLIAVVNMTE